jgi:2-polyprenyl-3-methyl-5-hydroxy-6-metoxy-1,4-benzoquinol methylase
MTISSDDRLFAKARNETLGYHKLYYSGHQLFEENSWLAKPDAGLMQLIEEELIQRVCIQKSTSQTSSPAQVEPLKILDLGCGVGRNAVPMAMSLAKAGIHAKIIGVDVLAESIEMLAENSINYGVGDYIEGLVVDNDQFVIEPGSYDLIVAISVLEHCAGRIRLLRLLKSIAMGLKPVGLVRIEMTTDRKVIDLETKIPLPTHVETPLSERQAKTMLTEAFSGFDVLAAEVFSYQEVLDKDGRKILWQSKQVSFSARQWRGRVT